MTRAEFERLYTLPGGRLTPDERTALLAELTKWSAEHRKRGKPDNFGPFAYAEEFLK